MVLRIACGTGRNTDAPVVEACEDHLAVRVLERYIRRVWKTFVQVTRSIHKRIRYALEQFRFQPVAHRSYLVHTRHIANKIRGGTDPGDLVYSFCPRTE